MRKKPKMKKRELNIKETECRKFCNLCLFIFSALKHLAFHDNRSPQNGLHNKTRQNTSLIHIVKRNKIHSKFPN